MKMKQFWFTEPGKTELIDVDIPEVGQNMVKVKVAYTAICATDVHMVSMGVMGAKPPKPLGHEASGVIVELGEGSGNYGFKVGDKVALSPVTNCGLCPMCKRGMHQYCQFAKETGAYAEFVVTHVSAIFKLPDDADLQKCCLVEPTTCSIRAMDLAQIRHGNTVAVSGVGGIGSIILNLILLAGGAKVTAIDPGESKRQNAIALGAQYAIDPFNEDVEKRAMEITGGVGFDYVFEASGAPCAAYTPLKILAHCGNAVYFAVFPPDFEMTLSLYDLFMKEARIQAVFTQPAIVPRAIDIVPRLQLDKIIGKVLPLSDIAEGFELFEKSIYPKIVIDCGQPG